MDTQSVGVPQYTISSERVHLLIPHHEPWVRLQHPVVVTTNNGMPVSGTTQFTVLPGHCAGHFPTRPILPGVLLAELAGQLVGITAYGLKRLTGTTRLDEETTQPFYAGVETHWRQPAFPGDTLTLCATLTRVTGRRITGDVTVTRGDQHIATFKRVHLSVG